MTMINSLAQSKTQELGQRDLKEKIHQLNESALFAIEKLNGALKEKNALKAISALKFNKLGFDPLDSSRPLNLFEQLNQTFTYLASFYAADKLFTLHIHELSGKKLRLNLGTSPGSDIETIDGTGIVAEVFASVNLKNNKKLKDDITKVKSVANANHRYVFFMVPNIEVGPYIPKAMDAEGVNIWSLGCDLDNYQNLNTF